MLAFWLVFVLVVVWWCGVDCGVVVLSVIIVLYVCDVVVVFVQ